MTNEEQPSVKKLMELISEYGHCRWSEGSSGATYLDRSGERRSREEAYDLYAQIEKMAAHLQQRPLTEREVTDYEAIPPEIEGRLSVWLTLGKELNPHTVNLVVRFARALAAKLADAEKKYGYSDGWRSPGWMDECRAHLVEHVAKGDPRDVAAYCAFLWHHGESTASLSLPAREEPTGWKLVPVEPTEAMLAAGEPHMDGVSRLGDAWEAMLSASPSPDKEEATGAAGVDLPDGAKHG